jgi:hypothetical protein
VVESVESSDAPAPEKPALLKGGMVLCWVYAVLLLLTLAMLPMIGEMGKVEMSVRAGPTGGPHSDFEFVSMTSASQLFIIPLLVISIVVAYGLAKNRYWSRAMMMTLLILGVVLVPPEMASPTMYVMSAALAVFGWWYLYRKANVVEYYRRIKPLRGKTNDN